ncbi:phosphotransferase [Microcella sp.]|uniref:phosphotransferase n=1 Tax=Microcella sp. TaxID=1913979 RepID=UPI00299F68EA|nr:phosphotransferase [Microcella sp.]MDX2025721.1 phosphotransferase [Microcella sp.]
MPAPSPLPLTAPFTPLSGANARDLVARTHGLVVDSMTRLPTERDDTFLVSTSLGRFVAKFAHPHDSVTELADQLAVLSALDRSYPQLPVQRIVATVDNSLMASVVDEAGQSRQVRVLTYLDGEPLGARPRPLEVMRELGALHARLATAIADIGDGTTPRLLGSPTPWNLLAVDHYAPLVHHVADADVRHLVREVVDDARDALLPAARTLPALLAHNDLHGDNVLVRSEPFAITGVLDFGDMTRTPRVADLAVAASYARGRVGDAGEPWGAARAYVAGFETEQPLTDDEHALLPGLVVLRIAQRAILNSAIAAANPTAAEYASRNLSAIARDLRELRQSIPSTIGARA